MKITVDDIKEMVKESVRQIVESYSNMDYDSYVLVDESDGAILGNYTKDMSDPSYDPYMEAVNDAKQKESTNKFGDYSVYGCIDDVYDDDTLVYETGDN